MFYVVYFSEKTMKYTQVGNTAHVTAVVNFHSLMEIITIGVWSASQHLQMVPTKALFST